MFLTEATVPMTTVDRRTGREAKLLREALRLSVRDFAARLGVGVRTVNKWDTALGQARRGEDPAWMYEFDHIRLLAVTGACYGQLDKTAAVEWTLCEALEALGPKPTRRRAEVLVDLARVWLETRPADGDTVVSTWTPGQGTRERTV